MRKLDLENVAASAKDYHWGDPSQLGALQTAVFVMCGGGMLADSVSMCAGYEDPTDPAENWYVPDLLAGALKQLEEAAA